MVGVSAFICRIGREELTLKGWHLLNKMTHISEIILA